MFAYGFFLGVGGTPGIEARPVGGEAERCELCVALFGRLGQTGGELGLFFGMQGEFVDQAIGQGALLAAEGGDELGDQCFLFGEAARQRRLRANLRSWILRCCQG